MVNKYHRASFFNSGTTITRICARQALPLVNPAQENFGIVDFDLSFFALNRQAGALLAQPLGELFDQLIDPAFLVVIFLASFLRLVTGSEVNDLIRFQAPRRELPDESDSQSGSLDPLKHRGRTGEAIDGRIQKLPVDSTGFQGRSGDTTDGRTAFGIPVISECHGDLKSHGGDQTHDLLSDGEALLTSHSSLPTPAPRFEPDGDNVIPMLDGDWFADDITERFRKFLRVTFGDEHYEENLRFIEQALNIKDKRNYSVRDYFLGEFYNDHVRRYKKRQIYWLFSSPKGSFNALIYMHRYRPDTVSVVLNEYLREFRSKLVSHKNHLEAVSRSESASQSEKTRALKETERVAKMINEIEE